MSPWKSRVGLFLLILFLLSGCNRLFFHPTTAEILTPDKLGLKYENIYITTPDNVKIHGWHLPATGAKKGSIIFFHGNAQNITTHIASVYWLPKYGYSVYIFDYRGYGQSQGQPSIEGLIIDANSVINYVSQSLNEGNIVIFGQSLGGAIAINAIAELESKDHIKGIVIDSSFSGFRKIAREKLSELWLTWMFQYPISLAFSASYDFGIAAEKIAPIPLLVIHGNADHIIPFHHGKAIFRAASPPKILWEIDGGKHIDSMTKKKIRDDFVKFLDAATNNLIEKKVSQVRKI